MNSEFIATFRAGPKTRRSEVSCVFFYSFLLFVALAVGTFLLLDMSWKWDTHARDRPLFLLLVLGLPLLISAGLAWYWAHRRFIFFIGLDQTHLCVGENPARRIPYEKLEMITLEVRPGAALFEGVSDSMMEFEGKGFSVQAAIEPEDRYKCAALLSQKCPDALFVDELGRDGLSKIVANPQKVIERSATYHRKRGWSCVLGAAFCALLVVQQATGKHLDGNAWFWLALEGLAFVFASLGAAYEFRKARQLRAEAGLRH